MSLVCLFHSFFLIKYLLHTYCVHVIELYISLNVEKDQGQRYFTFIFLVSKDYT